MKVWRDVVEHAVRLGPDCFIATVTPDGEPHLSVISPGYLDDLVIVATWQDSVKVRNLAAGSGVMLHWAVRDETGNDMLLLRGDPHLVVDDARRTELWESDCLPYELSEWYEGPDDPQLVWVEITPTYASLHRNFGAGGSESWRLGVMFDRAEPIGKVVLQVPDVR